jgi:hypothetical protein
VLRLYDKPGRVVARSREVYRARYDYLRHREAARTASDQPSDSSTEARPAAHSGSASTPHPCGLRQKIANGSATTVRLPLQVGRVQHQVYR